MHKLKLLVSAIKKMSFNNHFHVYLTFHFYLIYTIKEKFSTMFYSHRLRTNIYYIFGSRNTYRNKWYIFPRDGICRIADCSMSFNSISIYWYYLQYRSDYLITCRNDGNVMIFFNKLNYRHLQHTKYVIYYCKPIIEFISNNFAIEK